MKLFFTPAALVMASFTTSALADPTNWTTGPFDMPESAIYDSPQNGIVLSLIGGHPGKADGNGALALLSTEGDLLDPEWIASLDAPKGMAIVGTTLLVADLTRCRFALP